MDNMIMFFDFFEFNSTYWYNAKKGYSVRGRADGKVVINIGGKWYHNGEMINRFSVREWTLHVYGQARAA